MLINNKLKQHMCGEGYGSNTHRKSLPLDYTKLDGEISPKKARNKKKKTRETHEIGEEVVIEAWHTKDQSRKMIDDAVSEPKDSTKYRPRRGIIGVDLVVRIVEKRKNGAGREEYKSRIVDSYPSKKRGHTEWTQQKKDAIFGMIVEHQAQ